MRDHPSEHGKRTSACILGERKRVIFMAYLWLIQQREKSTEKRGIVVVPSFLPVID